MKPEPVTTLWYFLHSIPDPRRAQGKRHALPVVLLLAILALCCGNTSYLAMSEWAENYQDMLQEQLPFLAGHVPDSTTFYRVFSRLDVVVFEEVLAHWLQKIVPTEKGEGIAMDGKTISGTGIHIVAAFTHTLQSVLFEMGTDTKGKELVIGPEVLKHITITDHIVTGDALFAQKTLCEQIIKDDGGYVFRVKGNQEQLEKDIRLFFANKPFGAKIQTHTTIDRWKGKKEVREFSVSSDLVEYICWPGLTHTWQLKKEITKNGKIITEISVGIANILIQLHKDNQAKQIAEYIRGHWSIENRLHRQRDVIFHEDHATIRKGSAPQVMAALRNIVISIFHRATVRNFHTAMRRFAAKPEELFAFLGLHEITKAYVYA